MVRARRILNRHNLVSAYLNIEKINKILGPSIRENWSKGISRYSLLILSLRFVKKERLRVYEIIRMYYISFV
jgi:hypothetical protein